MEIKVETSKENEHIVTGILYDLGAGGLLIEDPQDVLDLRDSMKEWELTDINFEKYEDLNNMVINAYFPDNDEYKDIISRARKSIEDRPLEEDGQVLGNIKTKEIEERDWSECWKKYYKPVELGKNIVIKPSWEDYDNKDQRLIVEIDPGMAFGTGTHETTKMCAEILEDYLEKGDSIYDIGVGSGILSIIGAKLGASSVLGIDIDQVCIEVSRKNIALNKVEDRVEVRKGDLFSVVEGKRNLIVSNILAEIIVNMIEDVDKYLLDDGILITSGIIENKEDMVKAALVENSYEILETRHEGEWVAIVSKRR